MVSELTANGGGSIPPDKKNPLTKVKKMDAVGNTKKYKGKQGSKKQEKLVEDSTNNSDEEQNEVVSDAITQLEQKVQNRQRDLRFDFDPSDDEMTVQVYDSLTNELIRQIPSEEVAKMRQLSEGYKGVLFQGKA